MKKISLSEFAEILAADTALSERVRACSEEEAPQILEQIAGEMGYVLEKPAMERLSDDDLGDVAGGRNPFAKQPGKELNPYSWFVSILRRLMDKDDDRNDDGSDSLVFDPTHRL